MVGIHLIWQYILDNLEEVLGVIFLIHITKSIINSSLFELLWATHYHNKKNHRCYFHNSKIRDFVVILPKLKMKKFSFKFLKVLWFYFFTIKK